MGPRLYFRRSSTKCTAFSVDLKRLFTWPGSAAPKSEGEKKDMPIRQVCDTSTSAIRMLLLDNSNDPMLVSHNSNDDEHNIRIIRVSKE